MKQSPVQLLQSQFVKIMVEHRDHADNAESDENDDGDDVGTVEMNIEHMMHIQKQPSRSSQGETNGLQKYMLALGIRSGENAENVLPYTFELVVTAIVSVDPALFVAGNNPDDSAAKFGFSIIYGQIREMLTTVTGRMNNGQFTLPTMSFMDATYPRADTKESVE